VYNQAVQVISGLMVIAMMFFLNLFWRPRASAVFFVWETVEVCATGKEKRKKEKRNHQETAPPSSTLLRARFGPHAVFKSFILGGSMDHFGEY